jgi:hypothetical protein
MHDGAAGLGLAFFTIGGVQIWRLELPVLNLEEPE